MASDVKDDANARRDVTSVISCVGVLEVMDYRASLLHRDVKNQWKDGSQDDYVWFQVMRSSVWVLLEMIVLGALLLYATVSRLAVTTPTHCPCPSSSVLVTLLSLLNFCASFQENPITTATLVWFLGHTSTVYNLQKTFTFFLRKIPF